MRNRTSHVSVVTLPCRLLCVTWSIVSPLNDLDHCVQICVTLQTSCSLKLDPLPHLVFDAKAYFILWFFYLTRQVNELQIIVYNDGIANKWNMTINKYIPQARCKNIGKIPAEMCTVESSVIMYLCVFLTQEKTTAASKMMSYKLRYDVNEILDQLTHAIPLYGLRPTVHLVRSLLPHRRVVL